MSLIKCIECGKTYSDKASACPECGCPTLYILSLEEINKQEGMATDNISNLQSDYSLNEPLEMLKIEESLSEPTPIDMPNEPLIEIPVDRQVVSSITTKETLEVKKTEKVNKQEDIITVNDNNSQDGNSSNEPVEILEIEKASHIRNIIAIILGVISYAGLLLSLVHLAAIVENIISISLISLLLLIFVYYVSLIISMTGVNLFSTRRYALRVLAALQATILFLLNVISFGQVSLVVHIVAIFLIFRCLRIAISKDDPELKPANDKSSARIGLLVLVVSIVFSVIILILT